MSLNAIKELRELTNCGIVDCKKALEQSGGDLKKAKELLREKGLQMALKKASRAANEGRIEAYVHNGNKIGVVVEVNCETDFVARNESFIQFSKDLSMHIAAMAPVYLKKEDVPADVIAGGADLKAICLLEQPFVKDTSKNIQDLLNELVAKIGENIVIGRFIRYKIGE
jgi:elongation factor Ts